MIYTVRHNQSLRDIAITNYGSEWLEGLLLLIEHNDISLATELEAGMTLVVNSVNENDFTLQFLKARDIHVVTGQYIIQPVNVPTNLAAATAYENQNSLTWDYATNQQVTFEIERSPNGVNGWVKIGEANNLEFTDNLN